VSAASRRARAAQVRGLRAGVISRYLAGGLDLLVTAALLFGILLTFAVVRYLVYSNEFELPHTDGLFDATAFLVVEVAYLTAAWSTTGRTVGNNLFGLRVVRRNGEPCGVLRALARASICTAFGFISLLWAAVSRRNAAVHDLLLRTAVVHDWAPARLPTTPISVAIPEGEPV
jgi:uncharacterized RDD family membrane protein YckC